MSQGVYKITEEFEREICKYTGAPFCVAVDSCSNAIFLSLVWEKKKDRMVIPNGRLVSIPRYTFPSVPCEILHAGYRVDFLLDSPITRKGPYQLVPTNIWDSALRFTCDMYIPKSFMCLSFTGPRKQLKLTKGGAILTDSEEAYEWFKQARMSGRHEMPFLEDNIKFPGWNFYLNPELSTRGLMLMRQFYTEGGEKIPQEDVELEYPDLSKMEAFR